MIGQDVKNLMCSVVYGIRAVPNHLDWSYHGGDAVGISLGFSPRIEKVRGSFFLWTTWTSVEAEGQEASVPLVCAESKLCWPNS